MDYYLDLSDCKYLGAGCQGRVYLTPDGYAIKIYKKVESAKSEYKILKAAEDSRFFPNTFDCMANVVLREYVPGKNLSKHIAERGLTMKLTKEMIDLIEDFKRIGFTRINIRDAHIFVDEMERIKVIDPRKSFQMNTPYPKDIIDILVKAKVYKKFLINLKAYRPDLIEYWEEGYIYMMKSKAGLIK